MRFDLAPLRGAGPLLFGMRSEEVRKALATRFVTFRKGFAPTPSDHFPELGVLAHYDERGFLEALEFGRPAQPILDGADLLDIPFDRAKLLLRVKGGLLDENGEDATSRDLGLALWAPNAEEDPVAPCDAIMAAGPDYFERHPD